MGGSKKPPTRKHFPAGCQRWLVCFKSDGLDDGTWGGRVGVLWQPGPGGGWCCGGNGRTLKVDIGLGYVQNDDHVFFLKQEGLPP